MDTYDVIVIGAGASGLIAAGHAGELGAKVLVLEKKHRAGCKLLITGKGRCNLSNEAPKSVYYKNIFPTPRFLKHAFEAFFTNDIVQLMNNHEVSTTTERGNRIFPASDKASDVVKALTAWVNKYPVQVIFNARVIELFTGEGSVAGVRVAINGVEKEYKTANIIMCTGGKSYPATGSTGDGYTLVKKVGHSISDVRPALVPLVTAGNTAKQLQGLSLKNVNASVWINNRKKHEEFGEMLFTHFGLTGPIILSLSRFVVDALRNKEQVRVVIDLKPALDEQKLDARLQRDLNDNGKKQIDNICKLWMPSKLIPVALSIGGIDSDKVGHQVNSKERRKMLYWLKNFSFEVTGYRDFDEAIITAGGVPTAEIDGKTMGSKLVQGLYFAGEIIDLDANTGGYNLQIAFSTGWLAAQSCLLNI